MKVHVRTFGCRANHYDSEVVRAMAVGAGCELVDDVADADVAVFNSCAVTAEAERDVRKAVRQAARRNGRLRSVVMGCASALPESRETLAALPAVSHLVAGADEDAIMRALGIQAPTGRGARQDTVRATLRIQDGCDAHCTFCATTRARGANRSRAVDAIVDEAARLAEWHPEVVLSGTHIGTYGEDIGSSLGALVEQLVRDVPRARFRLSSIEATEVDDRLLDLLVGGAGRVAPHLHAPLQSGSDRVLKRMGRHWYTAESYARAVERLAARARVLGLGADVIVGFPGESELDFQATVALVQRLPFTYLHVFPFSARPGTAATRLPDAVPPEVARERSSRLRALAAVKEAAHRTSRAGTHADAIVIAGPPGRKAMTEDFLTVGVGPGRARGERFDALLTADGESLLAV